MNIVLIVLIIMDAINIFHHKHIKRKKYKWLDNEF